jgi:hypothetical protein
MLDDLFDEKIVVILEKDLKCKIVKSCVTRQVTIIFPTLPRVRKSFTSHRGVFVDK